MNNLLKFKCKKCKKTCYRQNYKKDYHKFCSRGCFFSYIRIKPIKKKKCLNCGAFIKIEERRKYNYKKLKFCNQKCSASYNNKKGLTGHKPLNISYKCIVCKKSFLTHVTRKRTFCSQKCMGLYMKLNNKKGVESPLFGNNLYNNHKAYFVKKLGHIVRSTWEEKICLILKNNNISYKFEKKMFILHSIDATYRPDIIINKKIIISIKGFLTKYALKKEQTFRKEYPNYKYIVITHIKNFKKYNFVDKIFDYNKIIKNPLKLLNYLKELNE